ncbi:MAG TPA: Ig-like domain-containing protein [Polyangiaceae bacterium]
MRLLRYFVLAAVPAWAFSGCLLPSFQNVDLPASAGSAGSAGMSEDAGPDVTAGQAGEAGSRAVPVAPELEDDAFTMLQGGTLSIAAPGVLENDVGSSLTVDVIDDTDSARPAKYDADALSISADGRLSFKPKPDFFGIYELGYTVRDKDGLTASAKVKIQVRPVAAELVTVRDGIGGFAINGAAGDAIGSAISSAGDVNHDGFDDILIGAALAGDSGGGRAYVVYGRAKPSALSLSVLPTKSSERRFFEYYGPDHDGAGNSVAEIGDLNGDKFADFAIAASASGAAQGAVYVLFGGALSGAIALESLPVERGIKLSGSATTPIAQRINRAGDVNGDGIPDLLVTGASMNGRVYAVLGSATLASSDIDSLSNLLQIEGGVQSEHLPTSFDVVGHVNDDRADEIVMASYASVTVLQGTDGQYPSSTASVSGAGSSYGFRYDLPVQGQDAAVAGAGDVNADAEHTADVLICENVGDGASPIFGCHVALDLRASSGSLGSGWKFTGFSELPRVAHGADISSDGFSDLLFADADTVYGVFGKKSGFTDVDVQALGGAGFRLKSEAGERVDSVVSLGDVNCDGIADYAIGDSSAESGAGSVFVIFGGKY